MADERRAVSAREFEGYVQRHGQDRNAHAAAFDRFADMALEDLREQVSALEKSVQRAIGFSSAVAIIATGGGLLAILHAMRLI